MLHDVVDGFEGFGGVLAKENAFARGESGGFDDDASGMFGEITAGTVGVMEDGEVGGGDVVGATDLLGE